MAKWTVRTAVTRYEDTVVEAASVADAIGQIEGDIVAVVMHGDSVYARLVGDVETTAPRRRRRTTPEPAPEPEQPHAAEEHVEEHVELAVEDAGGTPGPYSPQPTNLSNPFGEALPAPPPMPPLRPDLAPPRA